jgi:conjugal transfer pilus assembly protein TraW
MKKNIIISSIMITNLLFSADINEIYEGQSYKVVEKDLLVMIKEHIANNKEMIEKKLSNFQSETKGKMDNLNNSFNLPFVTKNEIIRDDLSYQVTKNDIAPKNIPIGTILYPLKYTHLGYKIYLINGGEKQEIEWLKTQDYKNIQARVWVVNGKLKELKEMLGVPIFFYSEVIDKRFKVKGTPSIINQDGEEMVFNYYKIER